MYKHYLTILLIFGLAVFAQQGKAQLIYFSDAFGSLYTVDIANGGCDVTSLGVMQYNGSAFVATDIAFHPNGKLYATNGSGLFEVNVNSQLAIFIGDHNTPNIDFINSLVCDSDGVMYAADTRLFTIDINTGLATNLGSLPCESAGDLAFNNDELYLACVGNDLLKISINTPPASQVVGNMDANLPFFGIVTFATDCSDVETFGTAGNGLYQIDVATANSTFVCNLPPANEVYGAAMETDFIASDCEIILDLDGDNSSGAIGIDFIADTLCGNIQTPIADIFDFIASAEGLIVDSMVIKIINGQLDGNAEQLILPQSGTDLDVLGSGTNHLTLINTPGILDADIVHPLENTMYLNTANPFTPGVREVSVQIFAEDGMNSGIAIAYIELIASEVFTIDLGPDSTLCEGEVLTLEAFYEEGASYVWNDGSTESTLEVSTSGTYMVTVTNDCGGTTTSDVTISFIPAQEVLELGPDVVLCPGESLSLDATLIDGTAYEWSNEEVSPVITITESGFYSVSVSASCGIQTDEIFVEFQEIPTFSVLPDDTLGCIGESILLDATMEDALTYTWQDGSTEPFFEVSETGFYNVTVSFQCGEYTDEVAVAYNDYDFTIDLGIDTSFCFGDSVLLEPNSPYALSYLWQDGSTTESFMVGNTGNYGVTVTDGCEEISDQVFLQMTSCCNVFVPNVFSPNFDGANDTFQAFSNCDFPRFSLKIYNRWGMQVYYTEDQNAGWDGQIKGKNGQEGVYVWLIEYNDGIEDQILSGGVTLIR